MEILKHYDPTTFGSSTHSFTLSERVNQVYRTSGSDNTNKCTYTYNEYGFRGDSFTKEGFKVLSLGCSITEGVGVNDNETWPFYLTQHIPNGVNMNFGYGARSNDYISRCLLTFFDLVKPDIVLIFYTFADRREYVREDGDIEPYMIKPWGFFTDTREGRIAYQSQTELNNRHANLMNWYKNHLLIKNFLETKKCPWVWNGDTLRVNCISDEEHMNYQEFNRFDGGYGENNIDLGVDDMHPGPLTHQRYANRLFNFINKTYPDLITQK
jgi:hypothetical protein